MFNAENTTIESLIYAMMIIIPIGATVRVISCCVSMMHDDEEQGKQKRRAKNALIFMIVAECAIEIVNLAYRYYG